MCVWQLKNGGEEGERGSAILRSGWSIGD